MLLGVGAHVHVKALGLGVVGCCVGATLGGACALALRTAAASRGAGATPPAPRTPAAAACAAAGRGRAGGRAAPLAAAAVARRLVVGVAGAVLVAISSCW